MLELYDYHEGEAQAICRHCRHFRFTSGIRISAVFRCMSCGSSAIFIQARASGALYRVST